jgi:hypothetical protein
MTRKRLAPVLFVSGLLVIALALEGFANFPAMQGPMGPPMGMPVNVRPKKCAPQLPCQPPMCGQAPCAQPMCVQPVCPPPACAPPVCAPPVCGPPPCPPPMCGPMPCAGMGGGPLDGFRNCLATVVGIFATPFRVLDNVLCSEPKCCPPECPPVVCCPPPPCGPPMMPTKAVRRIKQR